MSYSSSIRPIHGGNLAWAAAVAGVSPGSLLDFSASINPLGPPDAILQAMGAALADLRHYPDPGYQRLRNALGQHHGLDPDWVLPGNGAAELLTWAGRDLCTANNPNDALEPPKIGLFTPAFGDYERAIATFGGRPLACPLPVQTAALEAWAAAACLYRLDPRVTGYLLNNPHNPTGMLFPQEALLPLLETGKPVVVDEAFMDFLPPQDQPSLISLVADYPHLVVLRSLTKFYSLPGVRIGYAIAHPDRLRRWQRWRDPWPVNTLAAAATLAALQDRAFQERTWRWLPPTRQSLLEGLKSMPGLHPLAGTANFLLVRSEVAVPPLQTQLLQQHQILIRDCMSFPELGEHYFRVAVRTEEENAQLLGGLQQVLTDHRTPTRPPSRE